MSIHHLLQFPTTRPPAPKPKRGAGRNDKISPWTGPRVDLLIALWADGLGLTCSAIAARLNDPVAFPDALPITEDAVIGKIARLGLAHKDPQLRKKQVRQGRIRWLAAQRAANPTEPKRTKKRTFAPKQNPQPFRGRTVNITLDVSFERLRTGQCHYIEEASSLLYCGRDRAPGSIWCPEHRAICTAPSRASPVNKRLPLRQLEVSR